MCVSALPMSVCAANNIDNTEVEFLDFTRKFCDEYLLDPEESEGNRLIYNYAKRRYDNYAAGAEKYGRIYTAILLEPVQYLFKERKKWYNGIKKL